MGLIPCLAQLDESPPSSAGTLERPLPALDDEEGLRIPDGLPPVIDAHVHLFAEPLAAAIRRWFEQHGWPIRYPLSAEAVIEFLLSRGVERIVALHYAHKPGIARGMNRFVADLAVAEPRVTGLATVHPEDQDAAAIVREAFLSGLKGVKLHCHVQCMPPDAPALDPVYALCQEAGRPVVIHAGREPKSPAYRCDPHALCSARRLENVLTRFPGLNVVVPHLGADEFDAYRTLVERHDNLWLDTTMAIAAYLPWDDPAPMLSVRPERILYGTDFPNLPYAWDRELRRLASLELSPQAREQILFRNACELFDIEL